MVTPFEEGGAVDEEAARRLAAHLVETARTAWSSPARPARRRRWTTRSTSACCARSSRRSAAEATVVCGTGTNDTRHSIELTRAAAEAGADAALVVTPYYNKPNPAGVLAHFEAIAPPSPSCR